MTPQQEIFLLSLRIKKKAFAEYIDYKESNLSAIFKGRRRINPDLAIKFGEIFRVNIYYIRLIPM